MSAAAIVAVAVVGISGALVYVQRAEIRRYLKIKSM